MSERQKTCDNLLLLVGSNPLPNYLAALILKPKSIQLFYSPETEQIKSYLKNGIKAKLSETNIIEECIADATNAREIKKAFSSIPQGAHLNYTGGTKVMAAHARMAFKDRGGSDQQVSYLDERNSVLRFDDGFEIDLSTQEFELKIDNILGLHGIEKSSNTKKRPSIEDAKRIAGSVFTDIKQLPSDGNGLWLEVCTGQLVRDILVGNASEPGKVTVGMYCVRENGRHFEIDVAVVRGHRLYVISCTKFSRLAYCKGKLFEVSMRARQLGGDLARSAVVCLLNGSDDKGPYVDQLRHDVEDIWDAPNTPRVFGYDDLREWSGAAGGAGAASLKKWLES